MPHRLSTRLHPHTLPTLLGLVALALALIALAPSAL
jgi:hypothetical protein